MVRTERTSSNGLSPVLMTERTRSNSRKEVVEFLNVFTNPNRHRLLLVLH